MKHSRLLLLSAAAWLVAYPVPHAVRAEDTAAGKTPPPSLLPPVKVDPDALRARLVPGNVGLRPQAAGRATSGLELPYGISYHSETSGVLVPMDDKNTFGIGIGLNIGGTPKLDSPGSGLGLQNKGTPGIILQKKF